ncbi:hypothetical protein [Arcanobacterium haemolyticum]
MGIAIGNGQMIHAATPATGVRIASIYSSFVGGGRP